jgi:hypothetical protein
METGHWGKIDGSNEWKNCDTVVIFGLPYLPPSWSPNVFMALQGGRDTRWLQNAISGAHGKHKDIRQALRWGQIATNVIQASIGSNAVRRLTTRATVNPRMFSYCSLVMGWQIT